MQNTNKNSFLEGNIFHSLIKFALPMLLALFLQALYGAVDLWAVGQFAETKDIVAVSVGSQAMLVVSGFVTGLFMGSSVFIARKIGENDREGASYIFGGTILILGVLSVLITGIVTIFAPSIASFSRVPTEAFGDTVSYLRICGLGTIFIAGYNAVSSIFRGIGNSSAPLLFVGISCVINIGADVIFIKCFGLGAEGASMATVLSQSVSLILSLAYIKFKPLPFDLGEKYLKPKKEINLGIIRLGLPIALSDTLNEICYLIIIGLTNTLGLNEAAGVGVAEKLIVFLLLVPMAYMSAISSFVSQNIGGNKPERAKKALRIGVITAGILGGAFSYILFFHGASLAIIFDKNPLVIADASLFLRATSLECLILSVANCFTGYLSGLGKTKFVMLQGVLAVSLVKIPYAILALRLAKNKLFQIGFATVWGALFTLISCISYYIYLERKAKGRSKPTKQSQ